MTVAAQEEREPPAGHDHMGRTPVGSAEISDTSISARAARDSARSWWPNRYSLGGHVFVRVRPVTGHEPCLAAFLSGVGGGGAFADCAVYGSAATPITADVDSLRPYPSEIPDSYPSVTLPRGTPTQAHGLVGASGAQVLGELAGLAFGRGSFERRVIGRAACDAGSAGRSNTNSATQPDTPPQGIPRRPLKPGHHQVPMPMISRRPVQVELPRSFVLPAASYRHANTFAQHSEQQPTPTNLPTDPRRPAVRLMACLEAPAMGRPGRACRR